ncbi:MAG: hypothetical protein AB1403_19125 [Candidatus Riflebacteria bacterium]
MTDGNFRQEENGCLFTIFLKQKKQKKGTDFFITAFCDQVIVLQEGRIFRTGAVAEVLTSALITDVFQVGAEIQRALYPSLAGAALGCYGGASQTDGLPPVSLSR